MLVVWWAWIYATWMVNWFDPGSTKVRLILACVTLTSLLISAAIPTAFGDEAWLFAGAYVFMQIGRNVAFDLHADVDNNWAYAVIDLINAAAPWARAVMALPTAP